MKARPGRVVWTAILRAARHPLGICVGGVVMSLAGVVGSGRLAGAAVAGYALSAVAALCRPRLWQHAVAEIRRTPPALPFPDELQDAGARALLSRLAVARRGRECALGTLSGEAGAKAEPYRQRLIDLEESVLRLLAVVEGLGQHLAFHPPGPLRARIERLGQLAMQSSSRAAAIEYAEARGEVERGLRSIDDMAVLRDLVVARMEAMLAVLETVPWRLIGVELRRGAARVLREEGPEARHLVDAEAIRSSVTRRIDRSIAQV